jgi:hypothetical protein
LVLGILLNFAHDELITGFWKLKKMLIFARDFAGVAQLVEHDLAKVGVAGSSPVSRSN